MSKICSCGSVTRITGSGITGSVLLITDVYFNTIAGGQYHSYDKQLNENVEKAIRDLKARIRIQERWEQFRDYTMEQVLTGVNAMAYHLNKHFSFSETEKSLSRIKSTSFWTSVICEALHLRMMIKEDGEFGYREGRELFQFIGGSIGSTLGIYIEGDAMLLLTKSPYAGVAGAVQGGEIGNEVGSNLFGNIYDSVYDVLGSVFFYYDNCRPFMNEVDKKNKEAQFLYIYK